MQYERQSYADHTHFINTVVYLTSLVAESVAMRVARTITILVPVPS